MKKNRRKYTEEFKKEAVSLVTDKGYSYAEAGRSLGIHPQLLSRWQKFHTQSPAEQQLHLDQRRKIQALEAENRRLRMEQEILKKAAAFFARESQ